uniref:Neural Wiskott-Aldrich syndrome protein-like n=1 Tax=Phascolarctos cinereus TaxID=38626 RepID=A0A6P5K0Q5_PHACI|nr:neural Wiskott-Aldrich syndrome protein-like [Phascolarctos cinereus]
MGPPFPFPTSSSLAPNPRGSRAPRGLEELVRGQSRVASVSTGEDRPGPQPSADSASEAGQGPPPLPLRLSASSKPPPPVGTCPPPGIKPRGRALPPGVGPPWRHCWGQSTAG